MARTPSSSLTAKLCQTAGRPNTGEQRTDDVRAAQTPRTVLTLAVISVLQTAALITIALNTSSSTHVAAVFAMSALACFGLAPLIAHRQTAPAHNVLPTHTYARAAGGSFDQPNKRETTDETNAPEGSNHPPRRNKPPTFASVAPDAPFAAPNAALPANLSPTDHAWADLMARISHDLRTPLNAVIGFSELLQQETFGPLGSPRYQEYARHIHECGAALLKTAEDTLAMTSALTPDVQSANANKAPVHLHKIVWEAASFLKDKAASRALSIHIDIPAELEVLGEKMALRQILLNLMCEAISSARTATEIVIKATPDDHHYATLEVLSLSCREEARLDTLPMCVARSLLHFSGAKLAVTCSKESGWQARTRIEYANQTDFFRPSATPEKQIQSAQTAAFDEIPALATS